MSDHYEVERIDCRAAWDRERTTWDQFARQHLFCRFDWLSRWWECYGEGGELFVLRVADAEGPVGYFPWQRRRTLAAGRMISFLGSGDVCSDYMTLPGRRRDRRAWVRAAIDWLSQHDEWDVIDLTGAVQGDAAVETFVSSARDVGWSVSRRSPMNCWRIALPDEWDDYLARLSKSHRKQLRRFVTRQLETGAATLNEPAGRDEFQAAFDRLVSLHQARWQAAGEPGAFANPAFHRFIRESALAWFEEERCRIFELVVGDQVAASEIHFLEGKTSFAYQSGVDPQYRAAHAGALLNTAIIRRLIAEGWEALDYLRGDEPYKAHFRATPTPLVAWRIAAPRTPARLRHTAWTAAHAVKSWVRGSGTTEVLSHDG